MRDTSEARSVNAAPIDLHRDETHDATNVKPAADFQE